MRAHSARPRTLLRQLMSSIHAGRGHPKRGGLAFFLVFGPAPSLADIEVEKGYSFSYAPYAVMDTACINALKPRIATEFDAVEAIHLAFPFLYQSDTAGIWLAIYEGAVFESGEGERAGTFVCVYPDAGLSASDIVVTFERKPHAPGKRALPMPGKGLSITGISGDGFSAREGSHGAFGRVHRLHDPRALRSDRKKMRETERVPRQAIAKKRALRPCACSSMPGCTTRLASPSPMRKCPAQGTPSKRRRCNRCRATARAICAAAAPIARAEIGDGYSRMTRRPAGQRCHRRFRDTEGRRSSQRGRQTAPGERDRDRTDLSHLEPCLTTIRIESRSG